ncbi:MAG: tetratricopeptide repeat protein [Opitutaceae bacterium]|nr:tetratricopeptide repeat protein [Opitutaceae bacterium]
MTAAAPSIRVQRASARGWLWAGVVGIVVVGAYAFAPAIGGTWVWDDQAEIIGNALIKDPAGLGKIWRGETTTDYFPLKTALQWLQWRAWADNPRPYHITNVALHLLSALLAWRLFRKVGCPQPGAWLGGMLFAVHPLTVESVAWIAEFKNAVSLPPLLLAATAFVDFTASGRRRDYILALVSFVAAGLCKTSVVMLPPVLLLFIWWRRNTVGVRDLKTVAPFFAISAVLGGVTIWFQHARAIGSWEIVTGGTLERMGRAGAAMGFYLWKTILPVGLLPVYPREIPAASAAGQILVWALLAGVTWWCWRHRGSWGRHALLGFGWFALHLVPVLGLVTMAFLHFAWVADHFAYIPLIGVVGLAGAGCGRAWERWGGTRVVLAAAAALVLGLAVFATRQHAARFQSEETLWRYTLEKNPAAWVGHNNLAVTLGRRKDFAAALAHANQARQLSPDYGDAHVNAANYFAQLGRLDEALAAATRAEKLGAASAELHCNLGAALLGAGKVADALRHYEQALRLDPGYAKAHKDVGVALHLAGRTAEAVAHYERGLAAAPDAEGHANCGVALVALDRLPEALRHFQASLALAPDSANTRYNHGIALARAGQLAAAERELAQTVRLNPKHAEAYYNLGQVLRAQGRTAEAVDAWRRALQLRPELAEARARLEELERTRVNP